MNTAVFVLLTTIISSGAQTYAVSPESCSVNLTALSAELQRLHKADQADRAKPFDQIDWKIVSARDLKRRKRVAAIFAQHGFQTAADYEAAAMIYQHGTVADHYYQAFVWAFKADTLETTRNRKWLTGAALDRYLVQIGHRQLFATQMQRGPDGVWCYPGIEPGFPEAKRLEYVGRTLRQTIENIVNSNGNTMSPDDVKECEPKLKPTPEGFIPGFW